MSDLLRQLDDDQSVLLMYLAGELPDADRAAVDRRLIADVALRAELADMTRLHDDVAAAMSQSDAAHPPTRCEAAVRQFSRAMVAAALEPSAVPARFATAVDEAPTRLPRMAWWAYPIAAAAMLAAGVVVYNSYNATRPPEFHRVAPPPLARALPEILEPVDRYDSLARLEDEVKEVYSLRTPSSGFFGEADLPE